MFILLVINIFWNVVYYGKYRQSIHKKSEFFARKINRKKKNEKMKNHFLQIREGFFFVLFSFCCCRRRRVDIDVNDVRDDVDVIFHSFSGFFYPVVVMVIDLVFCSLQLIRYTLYESRLRDQRDLSIFYKDHKELYRKSLLQVLSRTFSNGYFQGSQISVLY